MKKGEGREILCELAGLDLDQMRVSSSVRARSALLLANYWQRVLNTVRYQKVGSMGGPRQKIVATC